MPLSLKDAEFAVQAARSAVYPLQRDAFLKALAVELERHQVIGPGGCPPLPGGAAASLRRYGAQRLRRTPPS